MFSVATGMQSLGLALTLLTGILFGQSENVLVRSVVGDESAMLSCGQLQKNTDRVLLLFESGQPNKKTVLEYHYLKSNENLWFADNPKVKYISNGTVLVVKDIEMADAGMYRFCQFAQRIESDCLVQLHVSG